MPNEDTSASTASIVTMRGDTLISANIGDSSAFAAIFNEKGEAVSVVRLNKVTHTNDGSENAEKEHLRIKKAQEANETQAIIWTDKRSPALVGRLVAENGIGIYRGLGGKEFSGALVPDADINVAKVRNLPLGYSLRVINACDGYTDGAGKKPGQQTKEGHELYLFEGLRTLNNGKPGFMTEEAMAKALVNQALFPSKSPGG